MAELIKHYTNGEITIVWEPEKCIHSANCFRGLPRVFNPRIRPWIQPGQAPSDEIVGTVLCCPSGALSIGNAPEPPSQA